MSLDHGVDWPLWLIGAFSAVGGFLSSYVWLLATVKQDLANLRVTISTYNEEHRALHATIERKLDELASERKDFRP